MKTLRISDDVHRKLTATVGTLMAQTGKMQTYQDAVEAMLSQSVILPQDLLDQIQHFVGKEKGKGYTTREDFLRDATRWRLKHLSGEYEHVEVLREKYERGESAVREMILPFLGIADYLDKQGELRTMPRVARLFWVWSSTFLLLF